MASEHIEKRSILLVARYVGIKTTMTHDRATPTRQANRKSGGSECRRGCGATGAAELLVGLRNAAATLEEGLAVSHEVNRVPVL